MSETELRPPSGLLGALQGRRPTWAEVDLDALSHNLRAVRRRVAPRRVIAVVKADAYGHGAVPVSRRLEAEGADMLGVAFPEEGLELREAGLRLPILVLGASAPDQLPGMTAAALTPGVYSAALLEAVLAEGRRRGRAVPFHLKVDTGMGRLGLRPEQLPALLERLRETPGLAVLEGVFTTLSCSDDPSDPHTADQLARFGASLEAIRAAGHAPRCVHAANSGGVTDHPASWFDAVRPGILLYGVHPSERSSRMDLEPALCFKTRLVLVKSVPAGTALGYGRDFVASRPSVIGTIAAGYADGLGRLPAEGGEALVRGRRVPFSGRISMDHATLDLTDAPGAAEGDEVVLIGCQQDQEITAAEFARRRGTIPYEALSRLGARVTRVHMELAARQGAF